MLPSLSPENTVSTGEGVVGWNQENCFTNMEVLEEKFPAVITSQTRKMQEFRKRKYVTAGVFKIYSFESFRTSLCGIIFISNAKIKI